MRKGLCFLLTLIGLSFSVKAAEKCVFDHVLVTLPLADYLELKNFLSRQSTYDIAGIRMEDDPSKEKVFAKFEDDSYLEVWDETKMSRIGYQDACRLTEKSALEQIAKEFKSEVGGFKTLAVVGRKGWVGDPQGGMFFIWQPKHIIDPKKNGIRQLLKLVKENGRGEVNSDLISDYERGGLGVTLLKEKHVMIATDTVGMRRVAVATGKIEGNGLVALRFQRKGEETDKILIQTDAFGSPTMFLELGFKSGTLVFRADQYQQNFDLLN